MKKKIIVFINILLLVLFVLFLLNFNQTDIFLKIPANKENFKSINQIEYREINLDSDNCTYLINEGNKTVDIQEYKGIEDCIVVPEEINGYKVENINVNSFSDCYNLETIKIPKNIAVNIDSISYFEIDKNIKDENYVVYTTTREYSDIYIAYLLLEDEEKSKMEIIPNKYYVPEEKAYSDEMRELYEVSSSVNSSSLSSYDLRDDIYIEVENQKSYGNCYAYASFSSIETNLALLKNEIVDLSEIHAAIMSNGYGGYIFTASNSYYANKIGPVYEEDFSMEDIYGNTSNSNYNIINNYLAGNSISDAQLSQIQSFVSQKDPVKYVTQTVSFPSITKSMKNSSSKKTTVEMIRKMIKEHIVNYGSIGTVIASGDYENYNGNYVMNNNSSTVYDHAVSIVGWDDNFPKENFPERIRPSKNGAYLVLNSWGDAWGNDGYFWISYEDQFVETNLVGVISVEDVATNMNCNSMKITDRNTNEILSSNSIKRGTSLEIDLDFNIENIISNETFYIGLRDSQKDYSDVLNVSGEFISNNQIIFNVLFDTDNLQGGTYILEITYNNETISRTFEILADYNYVINSDGTITLTHYTGKDKNVIVPSEYEGYKVSRIGEYAFEQLNIQSIVIPDGITLDEYVFFLCQKLESVTLPKDLKVIEDGTFYHCYSLKNIEIPSNVTKIGVSAFDQCIALVSVVIPDSVNYIGNYGFYNCASLESITLSKNLKELNLGTFSYCVNLDNIVLPNSIESIGRAVFYECTNLKNVTFSSELSYIGEIAFYNCFSLDNVNLPGKLEIIDYDSFAHCTSLKNINIPDSVQTIGTYAFYECISLEEIIIPASILSIGEYTFGACESLRDVTLSDNLKTIGNYAFKGCSKLTSITIPAKVTTIGEGAFFKCKSLENINISNSVVSIGGGAFQQCTNLKNIKIPRNVINLGKVMFYGCDNLEKVIIYKETTNIGEQILYGLSNASIYCEENSYAKTYAINNGYNYYILSNYTINYNSNSEDATVENLPSSQIKVEYEDIILSNQTPVRKDYEFLGWSISKDSKEISYLPGGVYNVDSDITLYAVWEDTRVFEEIDVTEYSFENTTVTYDGTEKSIISVRHNTEVLDVVYDIKPNDGSSLLNEKAIEVGEYIVTATYSIKPGKAFFFKDNINTKSAILTIEKATYDMSKTIFEDETHEYDGTQKVLEVTGDIPLGVNVSYENNNATDVGEYEVIARFAGDSKNYNEIANMVAMLKITPKESNIQITNKDALSRVYTGEAVEVEYTKSREGTVRIEYYKGEELLENIPTQVGEYSVKVVLEANKNYLEASDIENFKITKATYDMSNIKFEDKIYEYDGKEKVLEITGELPSGVKVSYENNKATDVGEYTAKAIFNHTDLLNYNEIPSMTAKLKITPQTGKIEITNKNVLDRVYNGNAVEVAYTMSREGTVKIEYYEGEKLLESAPIEVGEYSVKVVLEANTNYLETFDVETFSISKATYNMSGIKFEDSTYTYDETEKKIEITGQLPVGVNVSYENNKATDSGEYEAIAKFAGDSKNYNEIANMTAILKITPKSSNIEITNKAALDRVYNGAAVGVEYTKSREGIIKIEYYEGEKQLNSEPIEVGEYSVKVSLEADRNYLEASNIINFTITKATYDMSGIKFENAIYTYDGTEKKIEIIGQLPSGVKVHYENNKGILANEYKAIAKFIGDSRNYKEIPDMSAKLIILEKTEFNFGELEVEEENKVTYIENIESNTSITALKEELSSEQVEIYEDGVLVEDDKLIATGMEIRVFTGKETKVYKAIIKGDINRDGIVNTKDLLMLVRYVVEFEEEIKFMNDSSLKASDIYEDGEKATSKDILKLARTLVE